MRKRILSTLAIMVAVSVFAACGYKTSKTSQSEVSEVAKVQETADQEADDQEDPNAEESKSEETANPSEKGQTDEAEDRAEKKEEESSTAATKKDEKKTTSSSASSKSNTTTSSSTKKNTTTSKKATTTGSATSSKKSNTTSSSSTSGKSNTTTSNKKQNTTSSSSSSSNSSSSSSAKPAHTHNWEPVYTPQWIIDKAAWTETVPVYEKQGIVVCCCGARFNTTEEWDVHDVANIAEGDYSHGSYSVKAVQVQTGTTTVEHAAEKHQESVLSGYKCSCGATK